MQGEQIPIIETRIIDDNSSWSSLSDTEKDAEEPKPFVKQTPPPQVPVIAETSEARLARFNVNESDIHSLYCVGYIEAATQSDIIIQPGKDLLNLDNVLFVKVGDKPIVLGQIEDVFGMIETPMYCVKIDDYLRQLDPPLEIKDQQAKVYVVKDTAVFIDDAEIQSMRMDTGTDACFQSERDYHSSDDESEIGCARSQHDTFAKRNKSPSEYRNFVKKVKQYPYEFDNIHQHSQYQLYPQPTPGNMLLNYLQPARQPLPHFDMGYGSVQYPAPHFAQYNQFPQFPQHPSHQVHQYPPHDMNQYLPHNVNHHPTHQVNQHPPHNANQHQWPQTGNSTQIPPQHPHPQNNQQHGSNKLNSFFYQ